MKLNLGSGANRKEGWVNIDYSVTAKPDLVLNLDDPKLKLPYDDSTADEVNAVDFLEHINNIIPLMNELWRVLKPTGVLHVETPYAGTLDFYKDPTHVRPFVPETFKYFAEWRPYFYNINPWVIVNSRHTLGGENENRIWVTMIPNK